MPRPDPTGPWGRKDEQAAPGRPSGDWGWSMLAWLGACGGRRAANHRPGSSPLATTSPSSEILQHALVCSSSHHRRRTTLFVERSRRDHAGSVQSRPSAAAQDPVLAAMRPPITHRRPTHWSVARHLPTIRCRFTTDIQNLPQTLHCRRFSSTLSSTSSCSNLLFSSYSSSPSSSDFFSHIVTTSSQLVKLDCTT